MNPTQADTGGVLHCKAYDLSAVQCSALAATLPSGTVKAVRRRRRVAARASGLPGASSRY